MAEMTMFGPWRKSSYSANEANCVEIASAWRKASYSANSANCVEVATVAEQVAVRDSKNPDGPMLTMPRFAAFLADTKTGRFDL